MSDIKFDEGLAAGKLEMARVIAAAFRKVTNVRGRGKRWRGPKWKLWEQSLIAAANVVLPAEERIK